MSFEYSPRAMDVAVIVLGVAVGAGIGVFLLQPTATPDSGAPVDTDLSFSFVSWPPTYLFTWGIESGTVETPDGIDFEPTAVTPDLADADRPEQKFLRGEADIALVLPHQVPNIHDQRPNASVLPYTLATPPDTYTVVVPEESDITEPSQLAGTRIAATPQTVSSALTLIALEEEYGVNASTVDLVTSWDPVGMLDNGSVSAAIYARYPGDGFRSVLRPFSYFREEYGENASFGGFIVRRQLPPDGRPGEAVVQTLLESGRAGAANTSAVVDYYADRETVGVGDAGTFVSRMAADTGGEILVPMTASHREGIQRLYDRAYAEGIIDHEVNVSALVDAD